MEKNCIVIPVYNDLENNSNYSKCIDTWKYYCALHGIDLMLVRGYKYTPIGHPDYAAMCFDRWSDVDPSIFDYDRITFVDADTIVRWDAFDFNQVFKDNKLEIVVVPDQAGVGTANYHLNQWLGCNPQAFSIVTKYFNAGFVSMKSTHLKEFQKELKKYRDYYYSEKDINCHMQGIGKEGGVRIDAMDQTAVNIALQDLFSKEITFVTKEFNCQVPYLFQLQERFLKEYKSFEFLNAGIIFHLGSTTLAYTEVVNDYWSLFGNNYTL
jgi:hypothetical protein